MHTWNSHWLAPTWNQTVHKWMAKIPMGWVLKQSMDLWAGCPVNSSWIVYSNELLKGLIDWVLSVEHWLGWLGQRNSPNQPFFHMWMLDPTFTTINITYNFITCSKYSVGEWVVINESRKKKRVWGGWDFLELFNVIFIPVLGGNQSVYTFKEEGRSSWTINFRNQIDGWLFTYGQNDKWTH